MSNYSRGYSMERRVAALLREDGYWTVESRGSHGAVDVLAAKVGQLVLVQCKTSTGVIPPAERVKLLEVAAVTGGVPVVAFRPSPRRVEFRKLTGPGPKEWEPFVTDEVEAA